MDLTPGNTSICLVLSMAAGNSSLSEVTKCWGCEEQLGVSDQLSGNLTRSTNCTECLENVCSDFVAKRNWYQSLSMSLVVAFMGVLMLVGIPGNVIVLVVYYFRQHKTTANKFMMALASVDLHTCLLIHPYIISKCFHFYTPNMWVCKVFEYLLYVSQGSQGLMLAAVAMDRYYAVFKPLAFGYAENAAYMIPISLGVAIVLSTPILLFYGKKTVWLHGEEDSGVLVRAHVCHYSDEYDGSRIQFIFIICTLLSMLLLVAAISILYILIAVRIRKRNVQLGTGVVMGTLHTASMISVKRHSEPEIGAEPVTPSKQSLRDSSRGHQNKDGEDAAPEAGVRKHTTTSLGSTSHDPIARPNEIDLIPALDPQPIAHCSSTAPPIHSSLTTITVLPMSKSVNVPLSVFDQALRIHRNSVVQPANSTPVGCKVLFIVTTVFFLSWLPFWVLRFMNDSQWPEIQLTSALLNHLFFLNNAVNPLLYAFINRKFREECRMTKKKISTRLRYMCC